MRQFRVVCLAAAIIIVGGLHTVAQSRLDVVSVRETPAGAPRVTPSLTSTPGRLNINLPLEGLVFFGYGITSMLRDELIVGWPNNGIRDKRFEIQAILTTNETLSMEEQRRVVLEVLETRFNLRTHREQRVFDWWVMTLVRPGLPGPRLKRVDFNCAEIKREDAPKDEDGRSLCRRGAENPPGRAPSYHGSGTMERLVEDLQLGSRNLVLNGTGLQGFFVWDFDYKMDLRPNRLERAVYDDLGIKLEPKRLPASVVVIDDVRMPTPN